MTDEEQSRQPAAPTLRELREEKGWSQEMLARKLDVTMMTVWRIESAGREPSLRTYRKLRDLFGPVIDRIDFAAPRARGAEADQKPRAKQATP